MRKLLLAACLSALAITSAYANDTSAKTGKPLTDQQQKMKDCNGEAKTKALKGADRKSFMKECLSKDGAPAAAAAAPVAAAPAADKKASQKDKMKTCNADAKTQGLKGDARKSFMKTCLSGDAAATAAPAAAEPAPAAAAAEAPAADKKASQKEKMKTCNADAKSKALKGDDRKKFMSECLKG